MAKLNDDEIIAALEAEEAGAIDGLVGDLATERTRALDRYRGMDPEHPAEEGRSAIVSRDVTDTIEAIVPHLVRVFLGSDDIGQFDPLGPKDETAAKVETQVCNWYLTQKNDLFSVINATLRDALLLKNGYVVAFWRTRSDTMTEIYTGQSDDEIALLMQDAEVQVIEHTAYPDPQAPMVDPMQAVPGAMLHDVKVERKAAEEYVAVESVPPDELLISRHQRVTSLFECDFVEWKRKVSIGQLRAEGFKVDDDVDGSDDAGSMGWGQQQVARERYQETRDLSDTDTNIDPSRRLVTFRDAYIRIDLRGKGEPQLWRIARVSGSSKLALKEEVDGIPFAAFSPIVYPHSHIGTSVFDLIDDVGQIKTQLQRNLLDGQYLNLSGQMGVDVNRVNMDDMLVSRPGGIKRVDGSPGDAFFPVPFSDQSGSTLEALNYMDGVKIARSGVSGSRDALEPNSLNKTATGVQAQQAANNLRVELIARTLAGGFRDLFLIVHMLALKHSTKALQIKLNGQWTPVNPREWKRRTDFQITVGLGTGTPEAQMQKLMMMVPLMQQGQQLGMVGPEELHNFACELWKAAGYRVYERFLKDPPKGPDGKAQLPPPQPPEAVLVEQERQKGDAMKTQATLQHDQQMKQFDAMIKQKELELHAMLKKAEQEGALALQQSNDQRQSALDQQKAALEAHKIDMDKELQVMLANIKAATAVQVAQIGAGVDDGTALLRQQEAAAGYSPVLQKLDHVMAMLAAPKQLVRGPDGKVQGVTGSPVPPPEPPKPQVDAEQVASLAQQHHAEQVARMEHLAQLVAAPKEIVRDAQGKVIGVRPATSTLQ